LLGQRRTIYDFLVEIVEGCQETIGKADLYHKIRTQYTIFERVFNTAIRFKLIETIGNSKYQATRKGIEFLVQWAKLQNFLIEE